MDSVHQVFIWLDSYVSLQIHKLRRRYQCIFVCFLSYRVPTHTDYQIVSDFRVPISKKNTQLIDNIGTITATLAVRQFDVFLVIFNFPNQQQMASKW